MNATALSNNGKVGLGTIHKEKETKQIGMVTSVLT